MERQEAFDKVAAHLLRTGKPSFQADPGGGNSCLYSGSGCAMRPFIPEGENLTVWDDLGSIAQVVMHADERNIHVPDFIDKDVHFYIRLQMAHDGPVAQTPSIVEPAAWISHWKQNMRELARDYDLDPSILD